MGGAHHNSTVLYGSAPQFYVVLYYFTPQLHSFVLFRTIPPLFSTSFIPHIYYYITPLIYFYNICYKNFTPQCYRDRRNLYENKI